MKVLVLTTTYPRFDGDHEPAFVHYLSKGLSELGHEMIVLAPHTKGAAKSEVIEGVDVRRFSYLPESWQKLAYDGGIIPKLKQSPLLALQIPFLFLSMFFHALKICKKESVDVIHAHWIIPQGLIAILVKLLIGSELKVLVTSHGADLFSLRHRVFQKLKLYTIQKSDSFTVVSNAMKDYCRQLWDDEFPITVQSMGVDVNDLFVQSLGLEQREGFVFVGRLAEKKGCDDLIKAFAGFVDKFPSQQLSIIGDGVDRDRLQALVKDLDLDKSVSFVGAVPPSQVVAILNKAKFSVMPSKISSDGDQEGLGLVAVESLACGCISVVSDLPAIQDVHDCDDLQFEAGNVHSLSERLEYVFTHQQQCWEKSQALKKKTQEKFSWVTVVKNYESILQSVKQS